MGKKRAMYAALSSLEKKWYMYLMHTCIDTHTYISRLSQFEVDVFQYTITMVYLVSGLSDEW